MKGKRAPVTIVDGHSVIFGWEDLRTMHGREPRLARRELQNRLVRYQDTTGIPVVLVFDGKGESTTSEREAQGVQLIYAEASRTADDVIERLVGKYAEKHEITVVTDDRAEAETVSAFGGLAEDTLSFRTRVESAEAGFRDVVNRRRRSG